MELDYVEEAWKAKPKPVMWTIITLLALGGLPSAFVSANDIFEKLGTILGVAAMCYAVYWWNHMGFVSKERSRLANGK